jgi:UDP-N-acetylmuramoylalanine--D-glutamate ligase
MNLQEPILVVGYGKTGKAVAEFLAHKGFSFGVTERNTTRFSDIISSQPTYIELGEEKKEYFDIFPLKVVSPGINPSHFKAGDLKSKDVISELDLVSFFSSTPIVAITGTNGKSTVTSFIGEIFQKAQLATFVGGNLGRSFVYSLLDDTAYQAHVVEVSSYQLDYSTHFTPHILVITNLTLDHQERHGSMEAYWKAKISPLERMGKNDFTIINYNLKEKLAKEKCFNPEKTFYFSAYQKLDSLDYGIYLENDIFKFRGPYGDEDILHISQIPLLGKHNYENLMAGILTVFLWGIDLNIAKVVAESFSGIEHRLERLKIDEVEVYNDSKATNPESTMVAVEALEKNFILFLGGSPKDVSYKEMGEKIAVSKCQYVILCGDTAQEILSDIKPYLKSYNKKFQIIDDFDAAVKLSYQLAVENNWAFLFSPACASFDNFSNFEERGTYFKNLIYQLHSEK